MCKESVSGQRQLCFFLLLLPVSEKEKNGCEGRRGEGGEGYFIFYNMNQFPSGGGGREAFFYFSCGEAGWRGRK